MIIVPTNATSVGPLSVGSIGASTNTFATSPYRVSWNHTITTENYLFIAIGEFASHESNTSWIGTLTLSGGATANGSVLKYQGGNRLGVFYVPITGSGATTITYTAASGESFSNIAANSVAFNNVGSVSTPNTGGRDTTVLDVAVATPAKGIALFLRGEAYGASAPTPGYTKDSVSTTGSNYFWTTQNPSSPTSGYVSAGAFGAANPDSVSRTMAITGSAQYGSTIAIGLGGIV